MDTKARPSGVVERGPKRSADGPQGRPWVVMKFGGTSVASVACWQRIHDLVVTRLEAGERPLLVCSAIAGVSDLLEAILGVLDERGSLTARLEEFERRHRELAAAFDVEVEDLLVAARGYLERVASDARHEGRVRPERRPAVLALGELFSTALGARWLQARGIAAQRFDARELLQTLPAPRAASAAQRYLDARCAHAPDDEVRTALERCDADVVVTQGFIARDREGDTVLLGRGGSDTAAAYLAAKVGARRLEIWTDVPGLFSCNPRLVPAARFIAGMGYDEAESLAGFGAQVLHPRTIHPVREAGIPLHVRWTERPDLPGTRIARGEGAEGPRAVVYRTRVCLVTVEKPAGWKPVGVLADVSQCFKAEAVPIDLLTSSPSRIRVLVDRSVAGTDARLPLILDRLRDSAEVRLEEDVASVTVVGRRLPGRLQDLAPALERLAGEPLLMLSHCASDLSVTFVVRDHAAESVVRALHDELFAPDGTQTTWQELVDGPSRDRSTAGVSA